MGNPSVALIQSETSRDPDVPEFWELPDPQCLRRELAVRRQQHTSRPAELEPAHQNGQHGEAPCEKAGEVQNRIPLHRTKQRPHAEEGPTPRPPGPTQRL